MITKIRKQELNTLKKLTILHGVIGFGYSFAAYMVELTAFVYYLFSSSDHYLTPTIVFVSIPLIARICAPLTQLPMIISHLVQTRIALKRITNFFLLEELDKTDVTSSDDKKFKNEAISFEDNVSCGWSNDEIVLKDLNFKIHKGHLVAIVGQVGSGKSSLLYSIQNEMHKFQGNINVNGTLALVPQIAWMQNATFRDNILFGLEYNDYYYKQVIDLCAIKADFEQLAAGDQTEIGEKGINLSGGQKQRISFSRAVYSNSDIYLLDDPISNVDTKIGEDVFNRVIGPNGILNKKTRLFVTNSFDHLNECDQIIMLDKGQIIDMGSYNDLITNSKLFNDLIKSTVIHKNDNYQYKEEIDKEEQKETKKLVISNFRIIDDERMETGNVKLSSIISYIKSCSYIFIIGLIVCYIIQTVLQFFSSQYVRKWTDEEQKEKNENKNQTRTNDGNQKRNSSLTIVALLSFSPC
jgi:ABC-type multidrug transport system fused ATPase/permease subunit